MRKPLLRKPLYCIAGLLAASALFAAPAMAAKKVQSPYVEKGEWAIEHYGSYEFEHENSGDNYAYKSNTSLGYGVTDWLELELEAVLKNEPGGHTAYDATELVGKFQFWEEGEMPFDAGLYAAYEFARDADEADTIEAILTLAKDHGSSKHMANIIFEQQVGSHRSEDLVFGLAWQSLWRVEDEFKAGFEYYGEFGELGNMPRYARQSHQLGPVIEFEIPGTEAEAKLGYLAGISGGAFDSAVKWELEWEF